MQKSSSSGAALDDVMLLSPVSVHLWPKRWACCSYTCSAIFTHQVAQSLLKLPALGFILEYRCVCVCIFICSSSPASSTSYSSPSKSLSESSSSGSGCRAWHSHIAENMESTACDTHTHTHTHTHTSDATIEAALPPCGHFNSVSWWQSSCVT